MTTADVTGTAPERGYYLATVEHARGAFRAAYGSFVAPGSHDIAVMRAHAVDVLAIGPGPTLGPHPALAARQRWRVAVHGRLTEMRAVRLPGAATDVLLVATEKEAALVVRFGPEGPALHRQFDLHDRACRPIEAGILLAVQSAWRSSVDEADTIAAAAKRSRTTGPQQGRALAAVHAVQGLIKVVDLGAGTVRNERIEELGVVDVAFVPPAAPREAGVLAVLYATPSGSRALRAYALGGDGHDVAAAWRLTELEPDAHRLVAVPQPWGGLLVLADDAVLYANPATRAQCALAIRSARVVCALVLDAGSASDAVCRVLLGDATGGVHLLVLMSEAADGAMRRVTSMRWETLGRTTSPTCMAYVDAGVLFVGSAMSHARLVRLSSVRLPTGAFVEDLGPVPGLDAAGVDGPILDGVLVDADGLGVASTLISAVGGDGEGALQMTRRGASFVAEAETDVDAMGVFWLPLSQTLVVSGPSGTHGLVVSADGLSAEASAVLSLDAASESLLVCEARGRTVQATSEAVLVDGVAAWRPPVGSIVHHASADRDTLALATSDGRVHVGRIGDASSNFEHTADVGAECSALCVARCSGEQTIVFAAAWGRGAVRAISFGASSWAADVLALPANDVVVSLAVCRVGESAYLFAGTGSGTALYRPLPVGVAPASDAVSDDVVEVRDGEPQDAVAMLSNDAAVYTATLGTTPVVFAPIGGTLLALADRAYVVGATRGRVAFSVTNASAIVAAAPCGSHGPSTRCALVTASGTLLLGGLCADADRMHHERVHVGHTVAALAHHAPSRTVAALHVDVSSSRVVLYDQDTLALASSHDLPALERAHAVCALSATHGVDERTPGSGTLIVVGTSIGGVPNEEPKAGRLLVFAVANRALSLVHACSVGGTVYALASDGTDVLVATVNGTTALYAWQRDGEASALVLGHTHRGQVVGVRAAMRGSLVAVGDLLRSVTMLRVSADDAGQRLVEVARDHCSHWITDVSLLDSGRVLCSDNLGNVFVLALRPDPHFAPSGPAGRRVLSLEAGIHIGQVVNRIIPANRALAAPLRSCRLLATANGALLVFGELPADAHALLSRLTPAIPPGPNVLGDISRPDWRALATERRRPKAAGADAAAALMIDGDALAVFMAMDPRQQREVVRYASCPESDVPRLHALIVDLLSIRL